MREEPKEGRGGRGTAPGDGAPVGVASVKYSVKGTPYYVVRVVLLKMFLLVLLLRNWYTSWFSSILLRVPRGSVGACSPHSGERERAHFTHVCHLSHSLRIDPYGFIFQYVLYGCTFIIKEAR